MLVDGDMKNPVSLISINKYCSDVATENREQREYVNRGFENTEQEEISDSGSAGIKEKSKPNIQAIGFLSLFRYASLGDKILTIFATCVAMLSGVCSPVQMVIFGKVIDILVNYDAGRKNTSNVTM
ncbi:ABC transporter B family member 3-like [Stegodyphus dumicola]|uniref:ABC transporter B family member 3-like n=1 Tax=Stegodyphus dumicola TaxID=202533 RepID=UPI0015AC2561|nr:ABC transporter B family member 3-like [Stegodyphus dumicola]